MHSILIDGQSANTVQQVADFVHHAPRKEWIKQHPGTGSNNHSGQLTEIPFGSSVLFITSDGAIGQIQIAASGERCVESIGRVVTDAHIAND